MEKKFKNRYIIRFVQVMWDDNVHKLHCYEAENDYDFHVNDEKYNDWYDEDLWIRTECYAVYDLEKDCYVSYHLVYQDAIEEIKDLKFEKLREENKDEIAKMFKEKEELEEKQKKLKKKLEKYGL